MIDLHCHSIFSDVSKTPEELISLAEQGGISALALTDHDTVAGLPRLFDAASKTSVTPVSGVELSAEFGEKTLHILGYFFDPEDATLLKSLAWVQDGRSERNEQILRKLNVLGYDLTMDDIRKHAGDDVVGRPHFTAALMEQGHFSHPKKVYQQLLGKGKAAYVNRRRLSPEDCVELITKAGGVTVIAHPGQMNLTANKLRRLIRQLKPYGLGGIEVLHSSAKEHQVLAFERMCADFDLAVTGGSDFHGSYTPQLRLGVGFGELHVPDRLLEELYKRTT